MSFRFNHEPDGRAIARAAGTAFNPESDQCIARVRGDELLGGVVYTSYTGVSIGMHVAGFDPRWINNDMLWVAFDYPFNQLGCKTIFGQVPEDNLHTLEFDKKLGFKEVARIADVFPGGDCIVLAMRREDCRWLRLRPRILGAD